MRHERLGKNCKVKGKCKVTSLAKGFLMLFSTFTLSVLTIQAQETIAVTGGNASGSGGSVSYSYGQVVYTTNTGTNGSVAQGVQQPYEISLASGIEEEKDIVLKCSTFPNPTTDYIQLKFENEKLNDVSYQLFNLNGKLLENKKIESNETSISMSNLVSATYFLKVMQGKKEIKIFKIIKN